MLECELTIDHIYVVTFIRLLVVGGDLESFWAAEIVEELGGLACPEGMRLLAFPQIFLIHLPSGCSSVSFII